MTARSRRPPPRTRHPPRRRRQAGRGRTLAWLVLILVMAGAAVALLARDALDGGGGAPAAVEAPPPAEPFLIREGLRREDVAALLEEETDLSGRRYLELTGPGPRGARLAGLERPTSLEGFLFPATYEIGPQTTVKALVDAQVRAYRANTAEVDYRFAASRNLTRYDVLTIASMIEREVAVPRERRLVASVIYNRLRAGMMLGIDATVQYAVGAWKPELTVADLAIDSPYNTRRYTGLPPGPIASPGLDSIRAAARPARTGFLYYVARNDGTGRHDFSTNAEDFERDVAAARARGGS